MEPEEVAEAFDELYTTGKVRYFDVSNHKPMQIELLKRYIKQPLHINQLQFSIPVSNMVANGLEVNMTTIATAWILRHPANMQVVTGTASETRLAEIMEAEKVVLTREEWYRLYLAAGHILP